MTATPLVRIAGIALSGAMLAACASAPTPSAPAVKSPSYKLGYIKAVLRIPPRRQRARIDRLVANAYRKIHGRQPNFLPSATSEVDFTLVSINGNSPASTQFNFSILTSGCTAQSGGWSCSVTEPAPAGNDVYTIVACTGTTSGCGGTLLSESRASVTVTAGQIVSASYSLNPVVGSLSWASGRDGLWTNGNNTPAWTGSAYTCSSTCWDPLLNALGVGNTPEIDSLSLVAKDANGDVIVPASGGGSGSGSPNVPLYLTTSGTVDSITVSCGDVHVEYMNSSGNTATTSPLTADLANGFTNGSLSATNASIASPVSTTNGGTGTDFTGATRTAYGNDGAHVNFDAGSASYSASSSTSCTATDSNGTPKTATYYVGFDPAT